MSVLSEIMSEIMSNYVSEKFLIQDFQFIPLFSHSHEISEIPKGLL